MGNWKAEAAGLTQYCEVLILSGSLALFECFICFSLWEHNANSVWSIYCMGEGNSSLEQESHRCKGKSKVIQRNNKMLKQACVLELKVGLRNAANDNWAREKGDSSMAMAKMSGLCQTSSDYPWQNALLSPEIQLNGSQGARSLI